nr:hypothetical protein CFP56_50893 [Quercus suber]
MFPPALKMSIDLSNYGFRHPHHPLYHFLAVFSSYGGKRWLSSWPHVVPLWRRAYGDTARVMQHRVGRYNFSPSHRALLPPLPYFFGRLLQPIPPCQSTY